MFQVLYALISLFVWGSEGIFDKKALNKLNIYNALVLRYSAVFFLVIFAIFFMMYIGIPYICGPLFTLITGIPLPFLL